MVCLAGLALPTVLRAGPSTTQGSPAEMQGAEQWARRFGSPATGTAAPGAQTPADDATVPFSFVLDAQPSSASWPSWAMTSRAEELSASSRRRSVSWRDPKTGLEVVAEVVHFPDFPALEWVLRFKNHGTTDSPILEQVLPVDVRLPAGSRDHPAGARH
jgi:hypothetical protein